MTTSDQSRTPELPYAVAWHAGLDCTCDGWISVAASRHGEFTDPLYTSDQLREYGRACVAAASNDKTHTHRCGMCGTTGIPDQVVGCARCGWDEMCPIAPASPPDVQEAEPVADDWYTTESGSIAVDWDHDPSRQLSIILKKDGSVAYAANVNGKKMHGPNAMTPEFYDVLRELVAPTTETHDGMSPESMAKVVMDAVCEMALNGLGNRTDRLVEVAEQLRCLPKPPSGDAEDARRYRALRDGLGPSAAHIRGYFGGEWCQLRNTAADTVIDAMLARGDGK